MKKRTCIFSAILLALLGIKHLLDTRAGAYATGDDWLIAWYLALFLVCLAGTGVFGWLFHRFSLERIYLVAGLFFGCLYLLVLPPLSAPDEVSHYLTSYQLSSQLLGKQSNDDEGRVLVRSEDWFLEDATGSYQWYTDDDGTLRRQKNQPDNEVFGQTVTENTYRTIHEKGIFKWEEPKAGNTNGLAVSAFPTVNTTPLAYVPQAVGIALARIIGLNCLGLAYMGRLFNLLFFVIMTYFAMKKLPFGKEVLFGVAMLPMVLHLSASFSYDVMIMAVLFYFTAYCLHLAFEKERVSWRDVAVLAALMAVVGPCKLVYAVAMGLCLLIPMKKFGSLKKYLVSAAVVLAAFTIAMVLVNSRTIATYATEQDSYIIWAEDAGYSFAQLLHSPGLVIRMFYNTVLWQADYYHQTMIGAYLGNIDTVLDVPYVLVMLFSVWLLLLAFKKPEESIPFTRLQKGWVWFLFLGCVGLTMFSMLLAWTPVSSLVIMGVQGRYFLPLLPVLLMTLKNNYIVLSRDNSRMILFGMCWANAYVLLKLFSTVCMRI